MWRKIEKQSDIKVMNLLGRIVDIASKNHVMDFQKKKER